MIKTKQKETFKGSAYFMTFSSLIQTINVKRYITILKYSLIINYDEDHSGIPQQNRFEKKKCGSTGVKNRSLYMMICE